jgi:hypothetical protein
MPQMKTETSMPQLDFAKMEREIEQEMTSLPRSQRGQATRAPSEDKHYAPPAVREREDHTAVQIIAHAITRLTWKEAEKMGVAIQDKVKDGGPLTAAIQAWAAEWEDFQ